MNRFIQLTAHRSQGVLMAYGDEVNGTPDPTSGAKVKVAPVRMEPVLIGVDYITKVRPRPDGGATIVLPDWYESYRGSIHVSESFDEVVRLLTT